MNKKELDKEYNHIMEVIMIPRENMTPSECIAKAQEFRDFIERIYDAGYCEGYEKGVKKFNLNEN